MYVSYSVGEFIPTWKTNNILVQIHFRDPYWELVIGYPAITDDEIQELRIGNLKMAITRIDSLLFFLFSFGNIPWCDAPYEPRLSSIPLNYPQIDEIGKGAPLLVCIADSATGQLKAMRMVGMGHILTNRLHTICEELDSQRPIDQELYCRKIQKIYQNYPQSAMMLKTVNPIDIFALINIEKS